MPLLTKDELENALAARHGQAVQRRLTAASVGIAGLGGLGSHIAVHLARLGVGRLVLADFDTVDVTNLNRQHYTLRDLGLPKTEALGAQLREINPYLTYDLHTVRVTPQNAAALFGRCTVVCEAFDRAEEKAMLVETLLAALPDTPLVSGCGMAGYGSANTIRTTRRLGRLYVSGDETSDAMDGPGLMAPRVAVCAAHQAVMALRLILGECAP